MDFIYDQQDLYDFYDDAFYEKDNNPLYTITLRNPDLPFASLLLDIDMLTNELSRQDDKNCLAKMRWYTYEEQSNFNHNMK